MPLVTANGAPSDVDDGDGERREPSIGLGPALRHAWVGYQLRLDAAMADAGFDDRRFPDGRVLRLCSEPSGSTISAIGRELGITRQGAGKVVAHLRERGYVSVADSATSGREKSVTLTSQGIRYLATQRETTRKIDGQLRAELGEASFASLFTLLDALGEGKQVRMRAYLQRSASAYVTNSEETSSSPSLTLDTGSRQCSG
jgi:DNA-binding MarR family transcriptional regulator